MPSIPHGYPIYHRVFAQPSCRNIVRNVTSTMPFSVQPFSPKGKERATAVECDTEEPETITPNHSLPIRDKSTVLRDSHGIWCRKVSQLYADSVNNSERQPKRKRRKRWRLEDIYAQSLTSKKIFINDFDRLFNHPNLQLTPLNTVVTKIIPPAYKHQSQLNLKSIYNTPRKGNGKVSQRTAKPQIRTFSKSERHAFISPIPLSYGFGDAEERAERCRHANQHRKQNIQSVVNGLVGSCREGDSIEKVHNQSSMLHTRPQPPATFVIPFSLLRIHSVDGKQPALALTRYYRTYSSNATGTNDSALSGSHENALVDPVPTIRSSTSSLENTKSTRAKAKKPASENTSGFTGGWSSENWNSEGWKDELCVEDSISSAQLHPPSATRKRGPKQKPMSPMSSANVEELRGELEKQLVITDTMKLSIQELRKGFGSRIKPSPPVSSGNDSVLDAAYLILKAPGLKTYTIDKPNADSIPRSRRSKYASGGSETAKVPNNYLSAQKSSAVSSSNDLETDSSSEKESLVQDLAQNLRMQTGLTDRKTIVGTLTPAVKSDEILVDVAAPCGQRPIARLAHGLDRALFNHTVHWLQDPHSRVFNFPPHLQSLPPVTDFAFERLTPFVSSNNDEDLHTLAVMHSKQFAGTTSSLTKLLSQIYMLISNDKEVDISTLSMAFKDQATTFTPGLRAPATFSMHFRRNYLVKSKKTDEQTVDETASGIAQSAGAPWSEFITKSTDSAGQSSDSSSSGTTSATESSPGLTNISKDAPPHQHYVRIPEESATELSSQVVEKPLHYPQLNETKEELEYFDTYAIESGNSDPATKREAELNVLLWLGIMTEKFLTLSEKDFSSLLRKNPHDPGLDKPKEAYRYAKSSKFVMRSQLDCQDSRLPGSGVFDLKTRAALPIRLDQLNFQQNIGYQIDRLTGLYSSFEREYYDLIRSAFLKYNFQARIGNMDGIFVAYHNTARVFGFQYIPVSEMEARIYGSGSPTRGARIFEKCVGLMEALVEEVVKYFPGESLRCTAESQEFQQRLLLWVSPLSQPEDIAPIVELEVTVSHIMNGETVDGRSAIENAHKEWVMDYQVQQSRRNMKDIREALKDAQSRFKQFLPEGTTAEEMEARLENVDWASGVGWDAKASDVGEEPESPGEEKETEKEKTTEPTKFSKPSKGIRYLRRLAKEGIKKIQQKEEAAARKVVWGMVMDKRDAECHSGVQGANSDNEAESAKPDKPQKSSKVLEVLHQLVQERTLSKKAAPQMVDPESGRGEDGLEGSVVEGTTKTGDKPGL